MERKHAKLMPIPFGISKDIYPSRERSVHRSCRRTAYLSLALLAGIVCIFFISGSVAERSAHLSPDYSMTDLTGILSASHLTQADYKTLYYQAGLGKPAVDALLAKGDAGRQEILEIQQAFFAPVQYECTWNSPISKEEHAIGPDGYWRPETKLAPLENGDILITKNSHIGGWRNGHAALVVDADNETTLESVVIGRNSKTQDYDKWRTFPSFLVLRLKDTPEEERETIARSAMNNLNDIPYYFPAGVLSPKYQPPGSVTGPQCSHLVWLAYFHFGYDLDSDSGMIVTPKDIANSPLLEIVQIYGVDPDSPWS